MVWALALAIVGLSIPAPLAAANIQLPVADLFAPIEVEGTEAVRWHQNAVEAWVVRQCVIRQGVMTARAEEAVLWVDHGSVLDRKETRATVYLEGSVEIDFGREGQVHPVTGRAAQSIRDHTWFGRLVAQAPINFKVRHVTSDPLERPAVYHRGYARFERATDTGVRLAQFTTQPPLPAQPLFSGPPAAQPPAETLPPAPMAAVSGAPKRVQVGPRSNALIQSKSFPGTVPNQMIQVFTNGLRAVVDGVEAPELGNLGRIVIETDRLVLWGPKPQLSSSGADFTSGTDVPIELYMEGNIVFRQDDRLIYADRMYYNATYEYGVVLAAEVYTPVPNYQGMVRLKADVLQQLNKQQFQAYGAAITTSQLGVPSYWLQSERIDFQDSTQQVVNPVTGYLEIDPRTNQAAVEHDMEARSRNNFLYIGGLPVFYWPVMATSLRKPAYYIERFSIKNDSVFGTQILADWDLYQLLRIQEPPPGTQWLLTTDYLSERGPALGTSFEYLTSSFMGHPGPVNGWFDAWGIYDTGRDDLGRNRRSVVPDTQWRGRAYWRHRQDLPAGWQFTAQLGLISDRNFLEQYYEKEWDEWKDRVTSLELKRSWDNQTLRVLGQVRLNPSVSQTEWFPSLDHFLIGRSLLHDRLTWYAGSHAGYGRFQTLDPPTDPQDATGWMYLPWEDPTDTPEGGRFATRHEIDLPLQLGWFKTVPYATGELAHWQAVLGGREDVTRAFGQAGVRVSLPFWRSDPTVQNLLFNLNGIAHKVTLEADMFYADASEDLTEFPLYDPLDDDSQEHFRRYLGVIPWQTDPRNFALRSGIQRWVSSPTLETVDDLTAARLGIHQRWQTKRGLPGRQHVIDWIVLDLDGTLYPYADRDNFGEYVGQLEYDFRWHVGDRVTILSDGYADLFTDAFRTFSLGSAISRPQRGQVYGGIVSMEGPFSSTLLVGSVSYRLSRKWIAELAATYDLGPTGSVGERFGITRIGESALMRILFHADHGRDNVGASFLIEPRFLPNSQLARLAGGIPPVGTAGFD